MNSLSDRDQSCSALGIMISHKVKRNKHLFTYFLFSFHIFKVDIIIYYINTVNTVNTVNSVNSVNSVDSVDNVDNV